MYNLGTDPSDISLEEIVATIDPCQLPSLTTDVVTAIPAENDVSDVLLKEILLQPSSLIRKFVDINLLIFVITSILQFDNILSILF